MKSAEYLKSLRAKSAAELKEEHAALRKEQFNLRMQGALGQPVKSHLVAQARKNLARLKTVINSKDKA